MRNQLIESAHYSVLRQLMVCMSSEPEICWKFEMFGISLTNLTAVFN